MRLRSRSASAFARAGWYERASNELAVAKVILQVRARIRRADCSGGRPVDARASRVYALDRKLTRCMGPRASHASCSSLSLARSSMPRFAACARTPACWRRTRAMRCAHGSFTGRRRCQRVRRCRHHLEQLEELYSCKSCSRCDRRGAAPARPACGRREHRLTVHICIWREDPRSRLARCRPRSPRLRGPERRPAARRASLDARGSRRDLG